MWFFFRFFVVESQKWLNELVISELVGPYAISPGLLSSSKKLAERACKLACSSEWKSYMYICADYFEWKKETLYRSDRNRKRGSAYSTRWLSYSKISLYLRSVYLWLLPDGRHYCDVIMNPTAEGSSYNRNFNYIRRVLSEKSFGGVRPPSQNP